MRTNGCITYSKLHVSGFVLLHSFAGIHGIAPVDHLDERMSFVIVDNACLNCAVAGEERPEMRFS